MLPPIDYLGAFRRFWWLIAGLGILGAVVGYAFPAHSGKGNQVAEWSATADVGAPPTQGTGPGTKGTYIEQGVSTDQIVFYAHSQEVAELAGRAVGLNYPAWELESGVSVVGPGKKTGTPGVVQITGTQPTATQAAAFTNAYANALGDYMSYRSALKQNSQLAAVQQQIASVQTEIAQSSASPTTVTALQDQLQGLLSQEQSLSSPALPNGYEILQAASASGAVKSVIGKPSTVSKLGSSHIVRALIGLIVGALIGAGIALLRELLDNHLRTASRAAETFGYPVVAEIPEPPVVSGRGAMSPIDVSREPTSPAAEAYRMLRMSILFEAVAPVPAYANGQMQVYGGGYTPALPPPNGSDHGNGGPVVDEHDGENGNALVPATPFGESMLPGSRQVILVVSPGMESTRPSVAANLAATYAEAGQRAIVVTTADLHSGTRVGTGEHSAEDIPPEELEGFLQPSNLDNVSRLSLSHFMGVTGQLVSRAPAVLNAARQIADAVVVEVPPLLAVHDGEALTPAADVVIVVGELKTTTSDEARRAGEQLRRMGAPVLGVVVTGVQLSGADVRKLVPQPRERARVARGLERV